MTTDDKLRQHLAQAYTRAVHPEAIRHIHEALRLVDPDCPPRLVVCDGCGRLGLPERVADCNC